LVSFGELFFQKRKGRSETATNSEKNVSFSFLLICRGLLNTTVLGDLTLETSRVKNGRFLHHGEFQRLVRQGKPQFSAEYDAGQGH